MQDRRAQGLVWAAVVAGAATACGGGHGSPDSDEPDAGAIVDCTSDPRVDAYAPGLAKTSGDGRTRVVLVESDPAPPARGTNAWTVRLETAQGAPLPGATLSVTPFMPDHGHGSTVRVTVVDEGGGVYLLGDLYLPMPGVWRVTVAVSAEDGGAAGAGTSDFFFCIPG